MLPGTEPYACHLVDNGTFKGSWVYCWTDRNSRHVKLDLTGHFSLTAKTPLPQGLGGPGEQVGTRVTAGRFRCDVVPAAIECIVIATGKGFLLSNSKVVAVGSTTQAPAVPTPVFGRSAAVRTVSGTVLIEQPGSKAFIPLSAVTSVPLGTTIDTTNGTVQLTSARSPNGGTETGQFYSGVFKLTQTKARSSLKGGRSVGFTDLTITGGTPSGCASAARASSSSTHQVRRLWGNAHGNFRTTGRDATATVKGTKWLTEDTCTGTLVKVARGIVAVEDLRTGKTVLVRAGHSAVVRSTSAAPASAPCTKAAIRAALASGEIVGFGCAGHFAYAAVLVGAGGGETDEITVLLKADMSSWVVTSRANCDQVPKKIRTPACETN
jgi:hypothetical protein